MTVFINKIELKQALFHVFSQYGEIIEIQAKKNFKMKGQAFVVFKDLEAAQSAKYELNGAILFDKPMVIEL